MAKKIIGLQAVKFGPVATDGGMGTVLRTLGETVVGTMELTQDDNQTTDFAIEESDSPVESFVSQIGAVQLAWSSYDIRYETLKRLFGGTGNAQQYVGSINVLGAITPGTTYTNGFYESVPLTGGSGTGATADITISGNGVTNVEMVNLGAGYTAGQPLSAAAANIGGTGSGFSVAVTSVFPAAAAYVWNAPASFVDIEASVQVTDKKGNVVKFPRMKLNAKFSLSFKKDTLGQIDIVATLLQPTKLNEPRLTIIGAQ